jgi:protein-S-isoprenylcysteine O-methyltransferase Ste14
MADAQRTRDEASLGQLFAAASQDFSALIRAEVELARAEIKQDVRRAATGGGMFGAAGVFAAVAVILGSVAAVYGVHALGLTLGWSYLVVTGVYLLVAMVLALIGVRSMKKIRPPERTIRTTKENVAMLRNSGGKRGE